MTNTIELEYVKSPEIDEVKMNGLRERILLTLERQKKNKFGNSEGAALQLMEKYIAPLLSKEYREIRAPLPGEIYRFTSESQWASHADLSDKRTLQTFPMLAMCLLAEYVSEIRVFVEWGTEIKQYKALLPLIPLDVQDRMLYAKEIAPGVKFHIIFQPQWEPRPIGDPVIVAEADGRFFEIARWGGDVDFISEFLV